VGTVFPSGAIGDKLKKGPVAFKVVYKHSYGRAEVDHEKFTADFSTAVPEQVIPK
jgi:hypothetical protein